MMLMLPVLLLHAMGLGSVEMRSEQASYIVSTSIYIQRGTGDNTQLTTVLRYGPHALSVYYMSMLSSICLLIIRSWAGNNSHLLVVTATDRHVFLLLLGDAICGMPKTNKWYGAVSCSHLPDWEETGHAERNFPLCFVTSVYLCSVELCLRYGAD
jgi:hypothetical protein